MTFEHKIVFGLGDIKAVIFQCKCGARAAIKPESMEFPPMKCPCDHAWDWNIPLNFNSTESPFRAFLMSLARLRSLPLNQCGFTIFLELDKPQDEAFMRSAPQKSERVP